MTSILCLAHYCDVHGPTPLMVTEGLPVPCSACYEDAPEYAGSERLSSRSQLSASPGQSSFALSEALRKISLSGPHRSSSVPVSGEEAQAHRAAMRRSAQLNPPSMSAVETPPLSPRHTSEQYRSGPSAPPLSQRRDSSFRRTYDDYVTRRANPCDNCAMTLPRRQDPSSRGTAPSDQAAPTLRTRAPYARVYGGGSGDASPPASNTASSSDTDGDEKPRRFGHRRTGTITSTTSRSSASSISQSNSHTHYLDYTSTHEPVLPSSFSIIRASCLRTLSFESLPRNSAGAGLGSSSGTPLASPQTPSFVTSPNASAATSGGSIFFGDPSAGYTTAYLFRIPDIHARGHKRVYAFLALSTHHERVAMKAFGPLSTAFQELAAWIQALAEAEAERALESSASSPVVANPNYGSAFSAPQPQAQLDSLGGSSFLAAGGGLSRRMGTGFGGAGNALKARGLPELVGLPDFFIELHSRFVRLLLELGVKFNS